MTDQEKLVIKQAIDLMKAMEKLTNGTLAETICQAIWNNDIQALSDMLK